MSSTAHPARSSGLRRWGEVWTHPMTAVAAIVIAATLASVFAQDLVTGSQQEHLPLVALTMWPWAAAAVGYVLMAGRKGPARPFVLGVIVVWAGVATVAIAVPVMETGTDPTRIPLAALIAAPFGAVVTGFLAIAHAKAGATPIE
jgi:hypothetical protein